MMKRTLLEGMGTLPEVKDDEENIFGAGPDPTGFFLSLGPESGFLTGLNPQKSGRIRSGLISKSLVQNLDLEN